MYRLTYSSRTDRDLTPQDIADVLVQSYPNYSRNGVSGLMLYHDQRMLQVLEGAKANVEACFHQVRQDARNKAVSVRLATPAQSPLFTRWYFGCPSPSDLMLLVPANNNGGALPERSLLGFEQISARLSETYEVATTDDKQAALSLLRLFMQGVG